MIETLVRTVSRAIHGLAAGWRMGRLESTFQVEEWRLRRGLRVELTKMADCHKAIDALRREAAEILATSPWARELVADLLDQRLKALRMAAGDESALTQQKNDSVASSPSRNGVTSP